MPDDITREPDGSGFRFNHGRPWACSYRCRFCSELGCYRDTWCCDGCEQTAVDTAGLIRKCRRAAGQMKPLPARAAGERRGEG
jgi:hypothetical protein